MGKNKKPILNDGWYVSYSEYMNDWLDTQIYTVLRGTVYNYHTVEEVDPPEDLWPLRLVQR